MEVRKIFDKKGEVMAVYVSSVWWEDGLNFVSDREDFLQVGTWRYDEGIELSAHTHNSVGREVNRTQEVIHLKRGKLLASIYDEQGLFLESIEVSNGDTLILIKGGHGYKILEADTCVLEVKNGPYFGADIDRRKFCEV